MPNSLDDDELEEGELDDEGECDDVMPFTESVTSLKAVQDRLTDKIRSLAEGTFYSPSEGRLDSTYESGEDVESTPKQVKQGFNNYGTQRQAKSERRKLEMSADDDIDRGLTKAMKTHSNFDNTADDTCIDRRAHSKRSRNNIWSKSHSPRGPYESPHTTSDDDVDFDQRDHSSCTDHSLGEHFNNERLEHNSPIDSRNRVRRRHRRHHVNNVHGSRDMSSDKDLDESLVGRNYQKDAIPGKTLKSLMSSSRKRKLADTPMVERPVCRFFMDGKCSKGVECSFNHDCQPPKKPELCRYYMTGGCSKGKTCVYYHSDWPCKNFHRFGKCSYGDGCKFSHEELSAETRKLLDIPCGVSDENSQQQQKSSSSSEKRKIPSLLDIPIYLPGTAPRSSPPGTVSHTEVSRMRYFNDNESDGELNGHHGSISKNTLLRPFKGTLPNNKFAPNYVGEDEEQYNEEYYNEEEGDEEETNDQEQYNKKQYNSEPFSNSHYNKKQFNEEQYNAEEYEDEQSTEQFNEDYEGFTDELPPDQVGLSTAEENEQKGSVDEDSQSFIEEIYDDAGLMKLPVAQRQLYLRIQKNQRQIDQSENKTESAPSAADIADIGKDDNWYSSDEDERETAKPNVIFTSHSIETVSLNQPPTSMPATSSVQSLPFVFNVPPPSLMPPLLPPPQSPTVLNMPPFGLPIPNVPPPLIPPQQGLPPGIRTSMCGMPTHRLPARPNMIGLLMRPDLSAGLLGPGPPRPPGMNSNGPPPSLLGPNMNQSMTGQRPPSLLGLGQGGLLGHRPPPPHPIRQCGMMGPGPGSQPLIGPGTNLLAQNMNLPQFDIGQILSAIRSNMTTATPPGSTTTEPLVSVANTRDPRASLTATSATFDPRLRMTSVKSSDVPDSVASFSETLQPPESPPSPASPPAVNNEVNSAGLRVAYLLRRLAINTQPLSIPSHVTIDELKQRNDPRLNRYQLHSGVRRLADSGSPPASDNSQTSRRRSPSLYTLPDIILPPTPLRSSNDDPAFGTGVLRKDSTAVIRLPEALQDRSSVLHTDTADSMQLRRQSSTASSDSDTPAPKKVIDYRNDPRYKKKKMLNTSREEVSKNTMSAANASDEGFHETFRSTAGFYGTVNNDDDPATDSLSDYRTCNNGDSAKTEIVSKWNNENQLNPVSPPLFSSSQQSASFLSLTVAKSSANEQVEEPDEQVSLKDMFKTIDPTTSPFC